MKLIMGDVPAYVALCEDGDVLMRGDPAKNARSARSPASLMNPLLNLARIIRELASYDGTAPLTPPLSRSGERE
jgi:hypothetical protein